LCRQQTSGKGYKNPLLVTTAIDRHCGKHGRSNAIKTDINRLGAQNAPTIDKAF
jgi:hypothetical protein